MADKISEETRKILIAQAALLDNILQEDIDYELTEFWEF
jgi:hypothetical protein